MVDAARMAQNARAFSGAGEAVEKSDGQVLVSTTSGLSRFAPFALGSALTTLGADAQLFPALPAFSAGTLAIDAAFGIMLEPAAAGRLGRGLVCGLAPAIVSIGSSAHQYVRVNSSLALESATTGYAKIIWKGGTSGQQWCLLAFPAAAATALDWKVMANSADATPGYLDAKVENSIVVDATNKKMQLSGDVASPGNYYTYGTDGTGSRTWRASILLST